MGLHFAGSPTALSSPFSLLSFKHCCIPSPLSLTYNIPLLIVHSQMMTLLPLENIKRECPSVLTFIHSAPVPCSRLPSTHKRCAVFASLLEQPSPVDKIPYPLPSPPFWDHQVFCLSTKSIPLVQKYAVFPNLVGGGGQGRTFPFESFSVGLDGKESAVQETGVQSLDQEDPLEKVMLATHCSILAWRISWTEEPSGLQSMELQRVRHDWATNTFNLFLDSNMPLII